MRATQNAGQAPGAYNIVKEFKEEARLAKSFLGGAVEGSQKNLADNGVPGPGTYDKKDLTHLPGFRIVPHTNGSKNN